MERFDLIVIGSGPAGEKAAVKAAYFLHKVALIEKSSIFGGSATQFALPSKTLKETALFLSGRFDKGLYGVDRRNESDINVDNFFYRKNLLVDVESKSVFDNLLNHKVEIYHGVATFVDPHTIKIEGQEEIWGHNILIASGVSSFPPPEIPIDGIRLHTSETIMNITRIPKSLCIVGAGVIGCEFATIFSTLGVKVFLNNRGATMLPFCDQEIVKELYLQMEGSGIQFEFGKTVKSVDQNDMLNVTFDSGECLEVDMLLFAANRKCSVEMLKPENAQLKLSENGLIPVNEYYQTNQSHIYAAGDVIGYPSLANVSQDQGRAAVSHMFKMHDMESFSSMSFPIGIYTIPEISSVGLSEEKAISLGKEICIGRAYHADVARGIIMGAKRGFLKLVVNRHTQQVLGVHIIGHLASELIHEGVELIHNKKTLLDIISKNFNFPSLHELYKYAAYDALSYLTGRKMKARF